MPQSVDYFVNFFNNLLTVLILREGIIFPGSEPTWWLREGKLLVRRPGLASQLVARNSKLGGRAGGACAGSNSLCNALTLFECCNAEIISSGAK